MNNQTTISTTKTTATGRDYTIDKSIDSNRGFKAGDIITEVRAHPFIIKDGEKRGRWDFNQEVFHFEILEVAKYEYICRYLDGYDSEYSNTTDKPFYWGFWDKQPNYGFMKNGASTVRYYAPDETAANGVGNLNVDIMRVESGNIDTSTIDNALIDIKRVISNGITQVHPDLAYTYPAGVDHEKHRVALLQYNANIAKINAEYHATLPRKTKRQKARAAAYEMLLSELLPGAIQFEIHTYHYGVKDEAFILSEAMKLAEEQANMFVYEWHQYDDYAAAPDTGNK